MFTLSRIMISRSRSSVRFGISTVGTSLIPS
nr:MAG TPA: hypothetical protein [Caudoviricetes sp.]